MQGTNEQYIMQSVTSQAAFIIALLSACWQLHISRRSPTLVTQKLTWTLSFVPCNFSMPFLQICMRVATNPFVHLLEVV